MFESIYIAMTVIAIVSLIAFGFILVSGFKRSVLWGLAVLLIPFAVLVYAYKYWAEVKKPFLVYAACSVLSIGLVFKVFVDMGGMQAIEMAQKIENGTLTEQEAAQFMVSNMEMMQEMGVDSQAEIMMQMQADLLGTQVLRPVEKETTATSTAGNWSEGCARNRGIYAAGTAGRFGTDRNLAGVDHPSSPRAVLQ